MKKVILFTLLLALQLRSNSQDIIPIPVDTLSVWRIEREWNNETCRHIFNSIYYIDGTEIMNGKEFYKIYEEGYYYESPTHPWDTTCTLEYDYSGQYRGGIRSEDGITYGYENGNTPSILMDFTLSVGDTLYSSICYSGKVIETIDSVLVGMEYRKRFNFGESYCSWMIEGVGHERGLFESMDDPFENWSELICYGENGIPIFGNENCDITVGQSENKINNDQIVIYPNPTFNKILVKSDYKIKTYFITDNLGRIILSNKIELLSKNEIEIDLSNMKSGLYVLNLETDNSEFKVQKIIKR